MPDNKGCNGFSLLGGTTCFLANITALEESVDRPSFYLDTTVRGDLPLTCHGGSLNITTEPLSVSAGEDCCLAAREGPAGWECGEGAGDCGRDADCAGILVSTPLCTVHYCGHQVCGRDNCQSGFGLTGEFWDEGDDCCERACTPHHPCRWTLQHCTTAALNCREGAGHCTADSDCSNPGWALCGYQNCLNSQYFPTNLASSHFLHTRNCSEKY